MISPSVRRHRLAVELVTAREKAGMTQAQLAKIVGFDRAKVVRLENAKARPDLNDVMAILEALNVHGDRWTEITDIAGEAAVRGWWASQPMDQRQAVYADLEAGATSIREYQSTIVPGLLQIEAYTQAIAATDDLTLGTTPASPESVSRARAGRQRMLHRPGGPTYEVILDEAVVRRPTAPPGPRLAQLRHLVDPNASTTVRVLPVDAEIEAYTVPRSPFSLYTYRDPSDPVVAAVDTVTSDLVLTDENQVGPYERLWKRLRDAALSPTDSADLIATVATEIGGSRDQAV